MHCPGRARRTEQGRWRLRRVSEQQRRGVREGFMSLGGGGGGGGGGQEAFYVIDWELEDDDDERSNLDSGESFPRRLLFVSRFQAHSYNSSSHLDPAHSVC
ncbi:hypothetical protein ABZP36_023781 [Zizania latifolia]